MTLPQSYFDQLYAKSDDPWSFTQRWYERRKRALTLALLPATEYASAYEPGCSIGVLSRDLAGRCGQLLATDVSAAAVAAARQRCADLPQVTIGQAELPGAWPDTTFDLVVLSELGYYFDPDDLAHVAERAMRNGTVLAVHWRHPVADYPQDGDAVHARLARAADNANMHLAGRYCDDDLIAEVWWPHDQSLAARGGLL